MKKKETTKKKEKEAHICSKCLNEIKPSSLYWVHVKDEIGAEFQTLVCEDCIEEPDNFSRYEFYKVLEPLYKKRVYKKKKDA